MGEGLLRTRISSLNATQVGDLKYYQDPGKVLVNLGNIFNMGKTQLDKMFTASEKSNWK